MDPSKKSDHDGVRKVGTVFYLVVTNIGVVNTYTILNVFEEKGEENEEVENIIEFVRKSSIITFLHHSTILFLIIILGWKYPDAFEHWTSPNFQLSPRDDSFYWVFSFVIFMGIYSLTVILYRARNITTVVSNEPESTLNAMEEDK